MSATCDVCDRPTSWEQGRGYAAEEFRDLVAQGFDPDEGWVLRHAAARGISPTVATRQWKDDLVPRSTSGWLLCPACAARAARYLPNATGAQPGDFVLTELFTPAGEPGAAEPPGMHETPIAAEPPGMHEAPIATTDWLELMDYATLPSGEALVLEKYLSVPGRAVHVILTCPSCGGQTISAGGPSGSMTPLRAAYRHEASFLVCPSCGDDWLIRYLTGRYGIGPSELLHRYPGGADLQLDRRAKALHKAAGQGDLPGVRTLLNSGAPVNGIVEEPLGRTTYPLEAALQHPAVAKVLIDAGADVNAQAPAGGTAGALFSAAAKGHPEVVRLLLEAGASVDQRVIGGECPLHWAASGGTDRSEVIALLLEAGADVHARSDGGRVPLHSAAGSGFPEHVSLLLEAGADVNARDGVGNTPLHLAAASKRPEEVVRVLLDAGADVNARTTDERFGQLPLAIHRAADNEVEASGAIRLLLAAGSEVDVADAEGMTPLHRAATMGHEEIVGILLDAGADPNKRTTATPGSRESGRTPADCAEHGDRGRGRPGNPELAKKLRARERRGLFGLRRRSG